MSKDTLTGDGRAAPERIWFNSKSPTHLMYQQHAPKSGKAVEYIRADLAQPLQDDPQWDATDAAHPAWWRGNDAGVLVVCRELEEIMDGKPVQGVCREPWESIRRRVADLGQPTHPSR